MSGIPDFSKLPLLDPAALAAGDDRAAWQARLERARNGHDPVWHTPEQIDVQPLYTAQDLAAYGTFKCIVPFKNRDGTEMCKPQRFALASGKVRYVGDPVAFVVAETAVQARDAAEAGV